MILFVFLICFWLLPISSFQVFGTAQSAQNQPSSLPPLKTWLSEKFIHLCQPFFIDPEHPEKARASVQLFFQTFFEDAQYQKILHTVLRSRWTEASPDTQQALVLYCKNYLIDFCIQSVCVLKLKNNRLFIQKIEKKLKHYSVFISGDLVQTHDSDQTFELKMTVDLQPYQGQWKVLDLKPYDQSIFLSANEKMSRWLQKCRASLKKASPTAEEFLIYLQAQPTSALS